MSQFIDSDVKERIRSAIDIVELVGGILPLRRQGRLYTALCPWHDDSRPSLQVNPDRQSWKCWVCGDGGDIFSFVMKHEGVEFREALEMLAEQAGIELAERGPQSRREGGVDKKLLWKLMQWAEQQFHRELVGSAAAAGAREYLAERGIETRSIERFRLGFAPQQWSWLTDRARSSGFALEGLYAAGLASRSERTQAAYDRFRGRLMFPIHDVQGRTIAFGGRRLPGSSDSESAKYINSPETILFKKSEQLYGLDLAREAIQREKSLIVMEGYTDVIVAAQAGVEHVTAVLGTALGPSHVRLVRRFADRAILLLDGDDAGQRRSQDVLELFIGAQLDARIVTLPDALDPADFVLQRGADALRQLVLEAVDALEFKIQHVTQGFHPAVDTHRANLALEEILTAVARAPRPSIGGQEGLALREQQVLVRLARHFLLDESELRRRLAAIRRQGDRSGGATVRQSMRESRESVSHAAELSSWEQALFELLLERPDYVSLVLERIELTDLQTDWGQQLLMVYRDLEGAGRGVEYEDVLTQTESAQLKSILVSLESQVSARQAAGAAEGTKQADADDRLKDLFDAFQKRRFDRTCRHHIHQLEQEKLSDTEQLDLLNEIIEQQRIRQGISAPTDG